MKIYSFIIILISYVFFSPLILFSISPYTTVDRIYQMCHLQESETKMPSSLGVLYIMRSEDATIAYTGTQGAHSLLSSYTRTRDA
jgi:hypothetical protein